MATRSTWSGGSARGTDGCAITVDGVSTTIDTGFYQGKRATAIRDRVLLFSAYLTPGAHTVTITNVGSAGRVTIAIDALDFAR